MLRARIIPSLLVQDGALVKTERFAKPRYLGDPLNAVRIFNDKEVDELVVYDIGATAAGREPDYALIGAMAAECRMPLGYGGGVSTVAQAKRIMALGVEKVSLGAAAAADPTLVARIAGQVGAQSVVVTIDVKRALLGGQRVHTHNARKRTRHDPVAFARAVAEQGAGEVVLHMVDRDGMMGGYDLALARAVRDAIDIPLTLLGGAGSLADMEAAVAALGVIGVAAGSLFVYQGRQRAVLINYPGAREREALQLQVGGVRA